MISLVHEKINHLRRVDLEQVKILPSLKKVFQNHLYLQKDGNFTSPVASKEKTKNRPLYVDFDQIFSRVLMGFGFHVPGEGR